MRKIYVLYGWTPESGRYVSGIYSSKHKAEYSKKILENAEHGEIRLYEITTEILL